MLATVIEKQELMDTVIAAAVAGIGVTAIFSLMIFGASRFADLRRDDRPVAAAAAITLAGLALAATAAAIVIGIVVMTNKS
jgi:hypothetical protein